MGERMIITNNKEFVKNYDNLKSGDIILGTVGIKRSEEFKFLDLTERGILMFPSALSQMATRSKAMQALLFNEYMVEHTFVARDRRDLVVNITRYSQNNISMVVTKQERQNCGVGVNLWNSMEEVYTQASLNVIHYPFVVQPFVPNLKDIRVVILGDYLEAYQRLNKDNFRQNLYFGGTPVHLFVESNGSLRPTSDYQIADPQKVIDLCKQVMKRGKFPWAHVDVVTSGDNQVYLSEISLHGNLHGSKISREEYMEKIDSLTKSFLKAHQHSEK